MSVAEYLRIPDPTTIELMTVPVLFLVVLFLSLLAGLRWHAALIVTAIVLAVSLMGLASRQDISTPESQIGMAVAAMLIVIFWKLKSRKRA
jgi:FtsH-binding integral membrane protein